MKSNIPVNSGILKFTFTDEDDDLVASFKINPTDIRMAARAEEVSEWFSELKNGHAQSGSLVDLKAYNDAIEEKIAYILGGDARREVFGVLPATAIVGDGEMWANKILDTLLEHLVPAIRERKTRRNKAVEKYTAEYGEDLLDNA